MSDVALVWDGTQVAADLAVEANDLARDDGLQTAVLLSLFLDRRAEDADQLPAGETDRRGWWADEFSIIEGDRLGSRLWLLARSKETQDVVSRAEEYAREALAWLIEDKVAEKVEVTAEVPRAGVLALSIAIHRPGKDPARYRFADVWAAMEAA